MEVYAIVDVGGHQLKIAPNSVLRVPRMSNEVGDAVGLDRVLILSNGKSVEVGKPYIEGKRLQAEVVRHGKEKKIVIFKKKRRKNYRRKKGHRQPFTEIRILDFPS
ncbi:MAG: 50S ribosomal protein L21 [Candidatus Latescibacteria bacterium]|nr:50S ribosomal protein L21 [Candidatus Latescibacterota bacterium]NIM22082.1 50S ribosomal protein L21 [Candidatus Latescibacterota bacterium]NIM66101.1 50S ribosomal protein L21 [Candidatus Latescibacterota bacterium]NIO02509.1 50S ribosomal protein L21 [Candidatus Latescibacterota bacterium]NIO29420.1 50S ribosomal protein L21 [Candidatus Latescibacterota bacterium]